MKIEHIKLVVYIIIGLAIIGLIWSVFQPSAYKIEVHSRYTPYKLSINSNHYDVTSETFFVYLAEGKYNITARHQNLNGNWHSYQRLITIDDDIIINLWVS